MKKKIGVIFGGNSVEHEISIITALQAIENIDKEAYEVVPIYLSKKHKFYSHLDFLNMDTFKDIENVSKKYQEKIFFLENDKVCLLNKKKSFFKKSEQIDVDLFFPIVHGTNVEDGKLQGFLEMFKIPYIGPTTTSAVIGQEKAVMKDILKAHNINQTNYVWVKESQSEDILNIVKENLSYPVIVKPNCLGSSVGIFVAQNEKELSSKIMDSFKYDDVLVIEEALSDFDELNISLVNLNGEIRTSAIERVIASNDVLTYEDKYLSGSKTKSQGMASLGRELPAKIDKALEEEIASTTTKVYEVLRCSGIVRVDILLLNGKVYINEVNNIPGSLSYYLWEEKGISYKDLLSEYIEDGIKKFYKRKNKNFSFKTNVLNMKSRKLNK